MATILVYSHSETVRNILGLVLEDQGHDVQDFDNARLMYLAAHETGDLAIIDAEHRPMMTEAGLPDLTLLWTVAQSVPVIAVGTPASLTVGDLDSTEAYIPVPFDAAEIVQEVEALL